MRVRSEEVLRPLGLRPRQLVALSVLRDAGEPSQQDLAGYLRMDRTNLVGLLNELEGDGLIERRRSTEDRRRHVVRLTDAGAVRLARAEFALNAAEDEVLGALDEGQRRDLHDLLQQAMAGADEPGGAGGACAVPGEGRPAAGPDAAGPCGPGPDAAGSDVAGPCGDDPGDEAC
jgi:DNA-binding MarR family transcriptional regulator